jgi:transketolase
MSSRPWPPCLPELLGGSADLTGSNLTNWSGTDPPIARSAGNYISYGVREFGMTAIANGIALHGGFIPYTATFLVFSDYARNAIRLAALMKQRQVMVYTHDSIGLGEDGPTHQPIEQAASLRLIPGLDVWRPADSLETAVAWIAALERGDGPSCLLLSRQNLPVLSRPVQQIADIRRGGYVLSEAAERCGTTRPAGHGLGGQLGPRGAGRAAAAGRSGPWSSPCPALSVSTGSYQPTARLCCRRRYRPILAVEAAHPDLWWKYVGSAGAVIGIDRFGESAPAAALYEFFGITVNAIVARAQGLPGVLDG